MKTKIKVWLKTSKLGSQVESEVEIEKEEWESMSDKEKDEYCREVVMDQVEWGFSEV